MTVKLIQDARIRVKGKKEFFSAGSTYTGEKEASLLSLGKAVQVDGKTPPAEKRETKVVEPAEVKTPAKKTAAKKPAAKKAPAKKKSAKK
jgi:hypothetical protein